MTAGPGDSPDHPTPGRAGLQRLMPGRSAPIDVKVNGLPVPAYVGETLHTVLMASHGRVRRSEFGDGPRGGFCLMGACQDCWVSLRDGGRVRSCATYASPGMDVLLDPPA